MKFYLAPMEGITGYIYRNTYNKYFGKNVDKFFTPFIMSHEKIGMSNKEIADVLPENNNGLNLIPQVMTNSSTEYFQIEKALIDFGYDEVNLNFGCPSKTVVTKKRGAGILSDTDMLEKLLYEVFEKSEVKVSVKTRIGYTVTEEFYDLIEIFNKYEISELIIHPRLQNEYYNGEPHYEIYNEAQKLSKNPLIYNGNVFSVKDFKRISEEFSNDKTTGVMIGRGAIANPFLFGEICENDTSNPKVLLEFLEELTEAYAKYMSGDLPVLHKMKEIWGMICSDESNYENVFEFDAKMMKKLKKCSSLKEFSSIQKSLLI